MFIFNSLDAFLGIDVALFNPFQLSKYYKGMGFIKGLKVQKKI